MPWNDQTELIYSESLYIRISVIASKVNDFIFGLVLFLTVLYCGFSGLDCAKLAHLLGACLLCGFFLQHFLNVYSNLVKKLRFDWLSLLFSFSDWSSFCGCGFFLLLFSFYFLFLSFLLFLFLSLPISSFLLLCFSSQSSQCGFNLLLFFSLFLFFRQFLLFIFIDFGFGLLLLLFLLFLFYFLSGFARF